MRQFHHHPRLSSVALAALALLSPESSSWAGPPRARPADIRIQIIPAQPNLAAQESTAPAAPLPILNHGFATDQDLPGPLAPVITDLGSSDSRARDLASQKLMRLPPERLDDIRTALAQETDPEAIARLSSVAVHLFLKPRTMLARPSLLGVWYQQDSVSLLGISFEVQTVKVNPNDTDAIPMTAVLTIEPGFPVAQSLFVGDRIFAINGERFPPDLVQSTFPAIIRQFPPGALLTLSILRDGKTFEVPVQMGALPVAAVDMETAIEARKTAAREFLQSLKTGRPDFPTPDSNTRLD